VRNLTFAVVWIAVCATAGCTKTVANRAARFDGSQECVLDVAQRTGVYKGKYSTPADRDGTSVANSSRVLRQGQHFGFRRDESGALVAIAGDEEFAIQDRPGEGARFCWYHRHQKPTQFAKNIDAAMEATGDIIVGAVVVGAVGGAVVGGVILNDGDDDCDGGTTYDPPKPPKHRDHLKH